jgi:hypothetical protein
MGLLTALQKQLVYDEKDWRKRHTLQLAPTAHIQNTIEEMQVSTLHEEILDVKLKVMLSRRMMTPARPTIWNR